jgi:hypothetical protein
VESIFFTGSSSQWSQEKGTKKRPYNLREKKEKNAAYRSLIRPELADELYDKILNIVVVQKKY